MKTFLLTFTTILSAAFIQATFMISAAESAAGQEAVNNIAPISADLTQLGKPNSSGNADSGANIPQRAAKQMDNGRLAVNPLTGQATSSPSHYAPLTGRERWKLYWKQNYFSVGAYFGPVSASLLLDQTTDTPPEWGSGFSGYGLRLASRTASGVLQGTFQAPIAAVLHEDVRYISSGQRGFKRRALHAIVYSFATFDDKGRPTPNIANLGGFYASTAVSTVWLPGRRNVTRYTLVNGSEQIGLSVPVNLLQEFWPDVVHRFLRRHP